MSDPRESAPSASGSGSHRLANLFILAFLAFHVAMPLRYYLGDRGYDERFSWRMFSTLRLQQCQMHVSEAGADGVFRTVSVPRDVQVAWVNLLDRVRMPVVEKYLDRRCDRQGTREARYTRRCINTDGSPLPVQTLVMSCDSRTVRAQAEANP